MSFADASENCEEQFNHCEEKSLEADNGDHFQNDSEDDSDESVSQSIHKLKIVSTGKNRKQFSSRKIYAKYHSRRINVSLGEAKRGRLVVKRNKCQKHKNKKSGKRSSGKTQENWGSRVEANNAFTKKGKRCRLGGKAKGVPPEEETCDKCDSDEENDNSYFSRISLGYFQKFRDKSGASTSRYLEDIYKSPSPLLNKKEEMLDKTSEEIELLELEQWGKMNLVSSKLAERLNTAEDICPDTF